MSANGWLKTADTVAPARIEPELVEGYTRAEIAEIADNPELWGGLYGKVEDRLTKEPVPWRSTVLQRRMNVH